MREFGARVQHDKTPRPNSQVAGLYTEELLVLCSGRLSRGRGSRRGRWLPAEEVAERGALVGALLDLVGCAILAWGTQGEQAGQGTNAERDRRDGAEGFGGLRAELGVQAGGFNVELL